MSTTHQVISVPRGRGHSSQEVLGTQVFLIARDAKGLARLNGAECEKTFHEKDFAGGAKQ